jgi:integrase
VGLFKTERITVNRFLDLYLDSNRHTHSVNTQIKYSNILNYYVREYLGTTLIQKVNRNDIQTLFNFLLDRGLAPSTVRGVKQVLHAAFNSAVNDKRITENPVSKIRLPPLNKSSANSLTPEQANAFIAVKDDHWYGDAFVFQLHTGLRPQELLALMWDDIDFESGTVRVERACKWPKGKFVGFGRPKTKASERTIELTEEILDFLRRRFDKQQKLIAEHKESDSRYGEPKIEEWIIKERPKQAHLYTSMNLIFPNRHGRVTGVTIPRLAFKAMLQAAEVDRCANFRWYDLRHTHATFLLLAGVPYHEVAERMGHKVSMLFSTYAHMLPQRRRLAAMTLQKLIPIKPE